MESLIDNLFTVFLSGFGFGLVTWFGSFALGLVLHMAWNIMKK